MNAALNIADDAALVHELSARFDSALRLDEPMSKHTSWRVGGPAQIFFQPLDEQSLCEFLAFAGKKMPIHWVGLGSNLLVRDGGIRGAVISTKKLPSTVQRDSDQVISAGVGVPCTSLARQAVRWGLGPSEFFAGIPGSLGGALTMNAGAHGHETWDVVSRVRMVNRDGEISERAADQFEVSYRSVKGQGDAWFLSAQLSFDPDYTPSAQKMRELQDKRRDTQPLGLPSCGSVFANPTGDHSARLIEAAGLKGMRMGGAQVSDKHANFIINADNATAADIETLISHVAETVKNVHGIELRHEVRFLGERA